MRVTTLSRIWPWCAPAARIPRWDSLQLPVNYDWRLLAGPSYGQYATRIWDSYLFHTVPYYSQHKDDIEYDQFNQLGHPGQPGLYPAAGL